MKRDESAEKNVSLTFVHAISSLGGDCNQVGIDVLVQNGSISQHSSLRVDALDGALGSDLGNLLITIRSAEIQRPDRQRRCFLQTD